MTPCARAPTSCALRPATELAALVRIAAGVGPRAARRPPRAHRAGQPRRSTPSSPWTPRARGRRPTPPTPRWPRASPSARCTACRSRTRTPTPPAACGRRGARRCTPTPCPPRDELVVARLRAAGAIRVGKTNVPEFAAGSHTFNPVFGATHNPYRHGLSRRRVVAAARPPRSPPGWCRWPRAATWAARCATRPAFCNVVGLRPTPGRVPDLARRRMGWSTLSVQGPMGRTVADVALQLSVLAGPDPGCRSRCPTTRPASPRRCPTALDGLRVAWAPDLGGRVTGRPGDHRGAGAVRAAVFEDLGAVVEEACPDLDGADEVFGTLRAWLFEAALRRRSPAAPGQGQGVDPLERRAGREAHRPRPRPGRAAAHEAVRADGRRSSTRYDVLLAPTTQVLPFPVEIEYPTEIAGVPQENYLEWMRSCTRRSRRPAARRCRCPAGSRPTACRSGCRSSARPAPTGGCSRSGTPSSRPPASASAVRPSSSARKRGPSGRPPRRGSPRWCRS